MDIFTNGRLSRFSRQRFIPILGLCLLVICGTVASTYKINQLHASANRHSDAAFVTHDLIQDAEGLQRSETRMAATQTLPETSFDEVRIPLGQNLEELRRLVPNATWSEIETSVRAYLSAIETEASLIADSDPGGAAIVRETETLPAATGLLSELQHLKATELANATDARREAQFLLVGFRAFGVAVLCTLLLIYDNQRRKSMSQVRQQENQFRTLIQQSTDVVLVADINGTITYVTPAAESAFGDKGGALIGTPLEQYVAIEDRTRVSDLIVQSIVAEGRPIKRELRFEFGDGSVRTMESVAVDLIDNQAIKGVVITAHDVTERKRLLESLHYQAHHDSLTGLPNRLLLADRLDQAIKRADRNADPIAILFLDLNEFKLVNDQHGHAAGDELLAAAASKLRAAVRSGETVARIGGDEFVVVLEQTDREQAEQTAERIRLQLQSIVLRDEPRPVTASVGIAIRTDPLVDVDQLLRQADAAMYQMKEKRTSATIPNFQMNSAAD